MSARAPRGFTLVELVAVLAVFSLVAVMGLQAITGGLRVRGALETADGEAAAMVRTLALLRHDLSSAVPAAFHPAIGGPEPAFDAPAGSGRLAVSIGGQPALPDTPSAGLGRVEWQHDAVGQTLTRRVWPSLAPRDGFDVGPEVTMLEGVDRFGVSVLDIGTRWRPGFLDTDDPELDRLPRGVEITLESARYGPLRVVVAP